MSVPNVEKEGPENESESDLVDILINTLTQNGPVASPAKDNLVTQIKGKETVSFDSKTMIKQEPGQSQKILGLRTSLVLTNAPINKEHQTLLDTLAELACAKSPVKAETEREQTGVSFPSSLKSKRKHNNLRPRAMSEPWLVDESYFAAGTGTGMSSGSDIASILSSSLSLLIPISPRGVPSTSIADAHSLVVPAGIAAWASRKMSPLSISPAAPSSSISSSVSVLPQILEEDYSSVYNRNGRIGIYTREERLSIISRFQDKRKSRVWKKKIRYHCRKNLADRRVRVKGRFVRAVDGSSHLEGSFDSVSDPHNPKEGEGQIIIENSMKPMDIEIFSVEEEGGRTSTEASDDTFTVTVDEEDVTTAEADSFIENDMKLTDEFHKVRHRVSSNGGGSRAQGMGIGLPMGSAMDGMKAFWGAIHESSSSSSGSGDPVSVSVDMTVPSVPFSIVAAIPPATTSGYMIEAEELEEDGEGEEEEEGDLWDENGEVKVGQGRSERKRFRRHTIAY